MATNNAINTGKPIEVSNGGIGTNTLTSNQILIGQGTSAISSITAGTSGQLLVGSTSASPSFVTPAAGTGLTVTANASTLEFDLNIPVLVTSGGTGRVSMVTSYAPVCAGTTANGTLQVASTGLATSGFVLTSTGSSSLPTFQASSLPALTVTAVNFAASPYTVLSGDQFLSVDSSGGAISILLANAPTTGRVVYIKDVSATADTNNITVTTVGGAVTLDGATTFVMNTEYESISAIFTGSSYFIF